MAPSTPLECASKIVDFNRTTLSVVLDPTCTTAAVVDNLGRILLVDVATLTAVRMWKGYRDAQCVWVEAIQDENDAAASNNESSARPIRRRTSFLAIYAPRRGLLELWQARHGKRINAYSVGPDCQLISVVVWYFCVLCRFFFTC